MEKGRLLFIDNLRIVLVTLVILVHLSITYGGAGGWYLQGQADPFSSAVLTLFNASSQAFFMGLLFLISGYFTPGSYARKGPRLFLKDRLLRLGIPLVCYDTVVHPLLCVFLKAVGVYGGEQTIGRYLLSYYTSFHMGRGPLWFVEALLFFAGGYVLWRRVRGPCHRPRPARTVRDRHLVILAVLLGLATFMVRLWRPIGWAFEPLNLQVPFFVQYITLFILGILAWHHGWLSGIPARMGRRWLAVGLIAIVVVLPALFVLGGGPRGKIEAFRGGPHWQSFALSLWEQTVCVSLMVGLPIWFRERFNRQSRPARAASDSAYTAYIIHAPVIVVFAVALRAVPLPALPGFILAALVTVPLCFSLAHVIRNLPGARRIL